MFYFDFFATTAANNYRSDSLILLRASSAGIVGIFNRDLLGAESDSLNPNSAYKHFAQ